MEDGNVSLSPKAAEFTSQKKKKKEEIIIKVKVIPKLLQGTCICTHEILTESV